MERFYDMGHEHLAYAGMDDAGEMSSWYVLNAIGLYTFSPADPEYIVTVPLFPSVNITFANGHTTEIQRLGNERRIKRITADGRTIKGWFLKDPALKKAKRVVVETW
jgi:putative alpha-1,2-mannosidase